LSKISKRKNTRAEDDVEEEEEKENLTIKLK